VDVGTVDVDAVGDEAMVDIEEVVIMVDEAADDVVVGVVEVEVGV